MTNDERRTGGRRGRMRALPVVGLLLVVGGAAACDVTVTNPGPIQDDFLSDPAAHRAVVDGAGRQLAIALNRIASHGGAVTLEHTPSGLVGGGAVGVPRRIRQGILNSEETVPHWNEAQQARWVAEDGIRRFREAAGGSFGSYALAGRLLLHAGYANRLLGENMCQAVIDGGAPEDRRAFLERAEAAFTEAAQVAAAAADPDAETAAYAGRASVRVHLGDWAGAVADAGEVPTAFEYHAEYFEGREIESNVIWLASTPDQRSISVWNTWFETYHEATGDPRVAWDERPDYPYGGPAPEGQVLWYQQLKFTAAESPINLASGREMRLIEAESLLRDGDWPGAMAIIDGLRADVGVDPWTVSTEEEAWTALKRERGIELWLEGRRLGDVRRWTAESAPGGAVELRGESSCFPVPDSELETNPNL